MFHVSLAAPTVVTFLSFIMPMPTMTIVTMLMAKRAKDTPDRIMKLWPTWDMCEASVKSSVC